MDADTAKVGMKVRVYRQFEKTVGERTVMVWEAICQGLIVGEITSHGAKVRNPKDDKDPFGEWFPYLSPNLKMVAI